MGLQLQPVFAKNSTRLISIFRQVFKLTFFVQNEMADPLPEAVSGIFYLFYVNYFYQFL